MRVLIGKWLDRVIPNSLQSDPISWFRSRVLIVGSVVLGLLTIGLILQFAFFIGKWPPGTIPSVIVALALISVPFLLYWTASYKIPGAILSGVILLGLPAICYKVPFFPSPAYLLMPVIPVLAVYFVNTSMGVLSSLFLSGAIFFLQHLHAGSVSGYSPRISFNFAVYLTICVWIALLFAWLFERSRIWATGMLTSTLYDLEQANQAKDDFLARVSHELRTPLNAIIGYSEIIEEDAEEEDNQALLQDTGRILDSAHHLLRLVDSLLSLTQIESGEFLLHHETIQLADVLHSLELQITPLAQGNHNQYTCDNQSQQTNLWADRQRLQEILFHILANACKFTQKGQIQMLVQDVELEGKEMIAFTISDTGVGISAELQEHIFEPFSQADTSSTRKADGLGLGLPLARHACRLMGGDIRVESQPDKGTTFVVQLPVKDGI